MVITLLTDFGDRDGFTGAMKGVILSLNPQATVVDIAHHLEPQDVAHAAFVLASTYHYFPPGTIHVLVVDPGVGSERRALAAHLDEHFFVAPDNGCLTYVLAGQPVREIVHLTDDRYFRHPVSQTFQGRDVFAPVAAHLSLGVPLSAFGPAVDPASLVRLPIPEVRVAAGEIRGAILTIDRFGNLISNISSRHLERLPAALPSASRLVSLSGRPIGPLQTSYSAVPPGQPVALVSSAGYLEIAVNQGNAAETLEVQRGTEVTVNLMPVPGASG